jgi:hypothetical protein
MKLSVGQFYQAIRVNGETLTRINCGAALGDQPAGDKHGKMELELVEGVGVVIKTNNENVIVPLNNVAYAVINKEVKQKSEKK